MDDTSSDLSLRVSVTVMLTVALDPTYLAERARSRGTTSREEAARVATHLEDRACDAIRHVDAVDLSQLTSRATLDVSDTVR